MDQIVEAGRREEMMEMGIYMVTTIKVKKRKAMKRTMRRKKPGP
jgi:hypothetical protein